MAPPSAAKKKKAKTPQQTKLNFGSARGNTSASKTPKARKPANGNILNFFKKIEVEETLFLDDPRGPPATPSRAPLKTEEEGEGEDEVDENDSLFGDGASGSDNDGQDDTEPSRFNEDGGSSKRRKLSHDETSNGVAQVADSKLAPGPGAEEGGDREAASAPQPPAQKKQKKKKKGPFLDDSDSEGDVDMPEKRQTVKEESESALHHNGIEPMSDDSGQQTKPSEEVSGASNSESPLLKPEDSIVNNFADLDELEGFFDDDDDFEDGEESRERRFMEEQARLEAEEAGNYTSDGMVDEPLDDSMTESCPICSSSLAGITPDQATIHVNACLDGKPVPLPTMLKKPPAEAVDVPEISKRFAKAAVPRPGQANPISLGDEATTQTTSAFSKLMSGHAEDAAWATAAATESSSRGKPAYQRTCPFYKIMPGFFICVDAFRYGAVKGCNAYFLSHFHSDHYVGLTSNWCHGPIYCSKVTGSLVKQQLGTNAKFVKELEFEETIEVPGTESVKVTMMPANHCPGSSLFLFEKSMGRGPNPRKQRILHCGDFRACPAHVTHPLLKPDVVDSISGKTKLQKIDVCYLDTTYLNPRYSFPPQEDVISACAEFCKSISGDPDAADEAHNALKREKGTASVSKFFAKEPPSTTSDTKQEQQTKLNPKDRLLVICGTYSIGKERICKAIAQALNTKIFATKSKIRIIQQLGDPELTTLLTSNPRDAQVHMQMLMEIRPETLQDYLNGYKPHFTRIVGFRPSGWNFRGTTSSASANLSPSAVATTQLLHGAGWRTRFGARDLVAQRGSTREAMCFGVPYSEHSSFRELALFVMALRVEKVVPTVNVGSEQSRRRMKGWLDRWMAERRRGGVVRVLEDEDEDGKGKDGKDVVGFWEGKDGKGGFVRW